MQIFAHEYMGTVSLIWISN